MADDLVLLRQRIERCILERERAASCETEEIWLRIAASYLRLMECIEAADSKGDSVGSKDPAQQPLAQCRNSRSSPPYGRA